MWTIILETCEAWEYIVDTQVDDSQPGFRLVFHRDSPYFDFEPDDVITTLGIEKKWKVAASFSTRRLEGICHMSTAVSWQCLHVEPFIDRLTYLIIAIVIRFCEIWLMAHQKLQFIQCSPTEAWTVYIYLYMCIIIQTYIHTLQYNTINTIQYNTIHTHIHIHIHIHIYIYTYIHIYIYTYIHIYIYIYIYTYIYIYIHTFIHIYTYIHTYIYIYTYIYTCIYISILPFQLVIWFRGSGSP